MKFVQAALKNQTLTWSAFIVVMILGLASFTQISRREDPDLVGRFFQIIIKVPGADARQVEQLVADRVERALLELDNTKVVETTARPGVAILRVESADRTPDLDEYTRKLRARVDDLRTELPNSVSEIQINDRFTDTAAMIIAFSRKGASDRELDNYARKARRELRSLDQVANADLIGAQQEQISLRLDSARLAQLQITPNQIRQALATTNNLPETGGGINTGSTRIPLQGSGELESIEAIGNSPIASSAGSIVRIQDVARIEQTYQSPTSAYLRVNGERAVGVSLTMRKGLDITQFGTAVRQKLEILSAKLPRDTKIDVVNDLPSSVTDRMGEFIENLLTGALLIAVVTFLFMGIRSATIITLSLPITVVGIFLMMKLLGRDIQQISIAALIISLGLVVDNSIVVIDNIEKKLAEGMERWQAVREGTLQLLGPLVASNLTTVGAFAPLAFLTGGKGDFIRDLGLITSISTLVSLAFNVTIIPLIAGPILKVESGEKLGLIQRLTFMVVDRLRLGILWTANIGLRRAALTLMIAIVGVIISVRLIPSMGQQFFPGALRNQFAIDLLLPEGTSIEATEQKVAETEKLLRKESGVASFASYVGEGSPRFYYNFTPEAPAANIAQIVVNTTSIEAATKMIPRLQRSINKEIGGATIVVKRLAQGPPVGAPIAIRLSGSQVEDLRRAKSQVMDVLQSVPGSGLYWDDYHEDRLVAKLEVDQERARDAGVSPLQVTGFANLAYSGQEISKYREGDREIPIILELDGRDQSAWTRVEDMYLASETSGAVRLGDIAKESLQATDSRIVRRNGVRTLTIFGYSDGTRPDLAVFEDAWRKVQALSLPGGVTATYAGDKLERELSFAEIAMVSAVGVAFNIIVVAWLFPNWRIVFAIAAATPLSLIGGIFGLWITHQPFGFMAVLGIVSLGGVITNHTIVLFEYALEEQAHGLSIKDSIIAAGSKRFRPILLTVLLSIMGLIPQALNGGSLWPPLANTLIFGLLISLFITLIVVPSIYALLTPKNVR